MKQHKVSWSRKMSRAERNIGIVVFAGLIVYFFWLGWKAGQSFGFW